jgi:hypothetical protein
MYKFNRNLIDVDTFSTNGKLLVVNTKKGKLFVNENEFFIHGEKILGGYISSFGITNIVTQDKVYWYDKSQLFIVTKHLSGFMDIEIEKDTYLFRDENVNYCAYNIVQKQIVRRYIAKFDNLYPSCYFNECLLIHKFPEPIVQSLSLLTGNYEWETDLINLQLSESVTLKSIVGVWHNELLLWLNDALLVSLDINSGELLWSYDLDESVKAFGAVLMSPFYDEKEDSDTIHCFGTSGYLTFDLVSRKATFHKSFGYIGTGMSPHLSTKSGDYFYFVGRDYSIKDGLGVGIFNCKTFNIDWFYTSPEWKDDSNSFIVFSSAPQVTDNELYILENGTGTLHIFEREQV